ncbi:iron complex transport system permease protein [Pelagirhabdus alkalitolerans]|uniref:Iron complex transport system permease protein n=1 Tax=Pelagirhabdus alkalitolerans TaxID=1612202 RepID=A0A1G6GRM3_9BACI|nr:iron ABC transporter permease [Pelagirhabdus alkalitolerans]SDB84385.1 iron complex transport system permease protein [Pelagirhabdus alkalitolerans]
MPQQLNQTKRFSITLILSLLILLITFTIAMIFGAADIAIRDVLSALFTTHTNDQILIIREIRLPREIAAIFVGAALGVAGAMMQGMTRNPLADPGLLGLSAGAYAALAITSAIFPFLNYYMVMVTSFIGAAIGGGLVFGLGAIKRTQLSPVRMVIAGAAISSFLYAIAEGIGLYFKQTKDMAMWTAGGLSGTTWSQLEIVIPFTIIGIIGALLLSSRLTILSLSEEVAVGLGQNIKQTRRLLFLFIIILTGSAVALIGNMTFIGLMIPHIVRRFVGNDYRFIIPLSASYGAIFMVFADTVSRLIYAPFETPVVAIVSIFGLPFFLWVVKIKRGAFL